MSRYNKTKQINKQKEKNEKNRKAMYTFLCTHKKYLPNKVEKVTMMHIFKEQK